MGGVASPPRFVACLLPASMPNHPAPVSKQAARDAALRNRTLLALVVLSLGSLVVLAGLALQRQSPDMLLADLRTAVGATRTERLADGTRLDLGTGSAVDLRYDEKRRRVELVGGEVLVDVAADPRRPFEVATGNAVVRALGTRFLVRHEKNITELTVLESQVLLQAAGLDSIIGLTIGAGRQVQVVGKNVGPIAAIDAAGVEQAWRSRRLVVHDRPLSEVLDEIGRHRPGYMHFDRDAAAALRVSAVLPLDDTDRALQLLAANFPQLRVRKLPAQLVLINVDPVR